MRAAAIVVYGLALGWGARAQPSPSGLLQEVTRKVLDTVDRLPNYMCTQTIDRYQYEPARASTGQSCEPAVNRPLHLATSDRLRLDVAASGYHEIYSWVGESHFEDRSLFDLVGNGALSTGSFSSFLAVVFRIDNPGFSYKGPVTEDGRRLEEYEFRVPQPMSHYIFGGGGVHVNAGYSGSILVDPATADLARLEVQTDLLPPETGSCRTSSVLDYSRMRLNDTDFLLPNRTELRIFDANGKELKNITVYTGCHEFLGESTLHFGSEPEPGGAAGHAASASAAEWPAGLPFEIALTQSIDPATAAAGDRVTARMADAIRDRQRRILAPKGAAVTLRILEIRRFYAPEPILWVTLKPETVETGGAPRALRAEPDTWLRPLNSSNGIQRRRDIITRVLIDAQDPQAGVFQFWNIRPGYSVPSGFGSRWVTAAAGQ